MDSKDKEVTSPPTDSVSYLDLSPQASYLAAASWDAQIRVYEVQPDGSTTPQVAYMHGGPVLCVKWSPNGSNLVSAGADKVGKFYKIYFLDNVVVTGSWNKSIAYWEKRSPQMIDSVSLSERVYSTGTRGSLVVVATAVKMVSVLDLNNPNVVFRSALSPLIHQTRKVALFPVGREFAISSTEGRLGIRYIGSQEHKIFHRDEAKNDYSVNDISFHPTFGTFSTCGADGTISIWNKEGKQRLKASEKVNQTISCTACNINGTFFAYAASYDWSKGCESASTVNKIYILQILEEDVKPRIRS